MKEKIDPGLFIFQLYHGSSFIDGGNQNTQRKPLLFY
jgi:hypothetical protein